MKRISFLILMAMMLLNPAVMNAQENESLYSGWGFGFQVGLGGMMPTGSLSDDLKGCAVFTGGLMGEYNRMRLKVDVTYGQPSFKINNPYVVYDEDGRDLQLNGSTNTTQLGVGAQLGYTVWRQGKLSITPNAGVYWSRLSWELNDIKYEKNEEGEEAPVISNVSDLHENSFGWMASVDFDYRLNNKYVDNMAGNNSNYGSMLRISPFVARASYGNITPSAKGLYMGVTLSYVGLVRLLNY